MRCVISGPQFDRDVRRVKRREKDIEKLIAVVAYLKQGVRLPPKVRPHKLRGQFKGCWECHIEPDWLLIWEVFPEHILLIRTGSHTDLFE